MKKPQPPEDLWEQMDAVMASVGPIKDDAGMAIDDLMKRYNLSYAGMTKRVQKLTRQGKLIAGWKLQDGKRIRVYRTK